MTITNRQAYADGYFAAICRVSKEKNPHMKNGKVNTILATIWLRGHTKGSMVVAFHATNLHIRNNPAWCSLLK